MLTLGGNYDYPAEASELEQTFALIPCPFSHDGLPRFILTAKPLDAKAEIRV